MTIIDSFSAIVTIKNNKTFQNLNNFNSSLVYEKSMITRWDPRKTVIKKGFYVGPAYI
ncbi:hypothetical protein DDB_G0279057 [Dictyostelium discoideum AX4]|uniref:Uncharacterized protein n=1 Tax=Dictyostelium discoideum TaxID=44689 RepID=Q54XB7_DICDI|nr:hypothetical protein DDB_G0279057 [Dictyostelium discoideum AX4]EAL67950.1 hypothetical protein DDB_G0279057 [Dictyostelium discoideum AX4]|eukprot:XP_641944.1 hypothetical protein DDB_G0279057 [Dictyostelium discoideum AX4]